MERWYSLPGFADPMSSMSHLTGATVFLVAAVMMLRRAWPSRPKFWSCLVFALAAVTTLSISGVYHMMTIKTTARAVMLRLDVAFIFTLIAGTFTPIHIVLFRGWQRWGVLGVLWMIVAAGISLRIVFFESVPMILGTGLFLTMGWIGALTSFLLWQRYGWRPLVPVVTGGAFYSVGAIFNFLRWPTVIPLVWGPHETFHLCVLLGLTCHWILIQRVVDDRLPVLRRSS